MIVSLLRIILDPWDLAITPRTQGNGMNNHLKTKMIVPTVTNGHCLMTVPYGHYQSVPRIRQLFHPRRTSYFIVDVFLRDKTREKENKRIENKRKYLWIPTLYVLMAFK